MCSFRSTLLLPVLLTALAGEELPVTSTIQEVKVFPERGPDLSRSASKSLPLGASTVVFTGSASSWTRSKHPGERQGRLHHPGRSTA